MYVPKPEVEMTLLETGEWEEDLRELMVSDPGHTGSYYARALRDDPYEHSVRKRQVNHVLYASAAYRSLGDAKTPSWYLVDASVPLMAGTSISLPRSSPCAESVPRVEKDADGWELIPLSLTERIAPPFPKREWALAGWQREAHDEWFAAGCSGIVEAVTGSGKTRLAIAVIGNELDSGRRVLVLVPKIALQRQWATDIGKWFPSCRIELVGGDGAGACSPGAQVIVGVVNSVANRWTEFADVDTVIADEVHNYGANTFRRALLPRADRRLGLTATLERLDDAVEEVLEPYFGGVVFRCGFARAHTDGRLATARIGMVGVHFSETDEQAYTDASETMTAMRHRLIKRFGVPEQPFSEFMKAVAGMSKEGFGTPASVAAGKYLKARKERSDLLAYCPAKLNMIVDLSSAIKEAGGSLVFAERVGAAEALSERLRNEGLRMPPYHSDIPVPQRDLLLSQLRAGNLHGLCSAKALDEGIDVPDVDLGIIAAGTQQRRQMVQRLGRVLRPKADGGPGRFLIAYVHGTIEDPATGAHEGFLEMVGEIPGQVRIFEDVSDVDDIARFLAGDDTVGVPLPNQFMGDVEPKPSAEETHEDPWGATDDPAECLISEGQEIISHSVKPTPTGPDSASDWRALLQEEQWAQPDDTAEPTDDWTQRLVEQHVGQAPAESGPQPPADVDLGAENAKLWAALQIMKDSMARLRSRWEDAQDEVSSVEQALEESEGEAAELKRRLSEQGAQLSTVTAQRDKARRVLRGIRDFKERAAAKRARLEKLLSEKGVALTLAQQEKEQLEQLLNDKGAAVAEANDERDEALSRLEAQGDLGQLLSEKTAALAEALAERDVALSAAEEAELRATRGVLQVTELTNREADTERRLKAEIARLQDLLAAQVKRSQELEVANAQLARRAEVAEAQSATASDRVADLERRLGRALSDDADRLMPQVGQERHEATVRGVRIRTSMKPDRMQSLGDLLRQASEE